MKNRLIQIIKTKEYKENTEKAITGRSCKRSTTARNSVDNRIMNLESHIAAIAIGMEL